MACSRNSEATPAYGFKIRTFFNNHQFNLLYLIIITTSGITIYYYFGLALNPWAYHNREGVIEPSWI